MKEFLYQSSTIPVLMTLDGVIVRVGDNVTRRRAFSGRKWFGGNMMPVGVSSCAFKVSILRDTFPPFFKSTTLMEPSLMPSG